MQQNDGLFINEVATCQEKALLHFDNICHTGD